jgi:hypothetical protein
MGGLYPPSCAWWGNDHPFEVPLVTFTALSAPHSAIPPGALFAVGVLKRPTELLIESNPDVRDIVFQEFVLNP